MSNSVRFYQLVVEAIGEMWRLWGNDEPLYLTVGEVAKHAGVSKMTARKYLEILHSEGWLGRKPIGKKIVVYPIVL